MSAIDNYYSQNISEYFPGGVINDMELLNNFISSFSCPLNPEVENFFKKSAIEFTKKHQSVTYLVFPKQEAELLGYFSLTIKPLYISADRLSNSLKKKIERTSRFEESTQTYETAAYLIAQLGKNYTDSANTKISGEEFISVVFDMLKRIQYKAGGVIAFAEAENRDKLLNFYLNNHFWLSDKRFDDNGTELLQFVRIIK